MQYCTNGLAGVSIGLASTADGRCILLPGSVGNEEIAADGATSRDGNMEPMEKNLILLDSRHVYTSVIEQICFIHNWMTTCL